MSTPKPITGYKKTNIYIDVFGISHQVMNRIMRKNANPNKDIKFLSSQDEIDYFLNALHQEFIDASQKMAKLSANNVVLAFDPSGEKSFRHKLYSEYKQSASRTKEKKYDSDGFGSAMLKYYELLMMHNIKALKHDGLEADDLLFLLKKHTVGDENICIVSSDGDLKQLMDERTFVYNNIFDTIHVTKDLRRPQTSNTIDELDQYGGFFGSDISQVDEMLDRNHELFFTSATLVNPQHLLVEKVIAGDTSDNIKSCFRYKKGTMEYGFTDKRFQKMIESGQEITTEFIANEKNYSTFIDIMVADTKSATRLSEQKKKDFEMLTFNRNLIDLNEGYKQYSTFKDVTKLGEEIEAMLSTPNVPLSRLVIEAPIGIDY
jgi:5'-3' exonuclease